MEEQSQQKKSTKANQPNDREWPNPRNASHANPRSVFGLDGENTQETPNPQADSQSLVPSPPSPPHSNQGGGRRGGRGGGRGRGRGRGRGHNEKRKWYCIFHKENDDHNSNYGPDKKRFEAILEEERKEKERASAVNHSTPAWQNPSFGRTLSQTHSSHLNSIHLNPSHHLLIIPSLRPGNRKLSKLRTLSVDPSSNIPLLLHLLTKALQLPHCQRSSRAKAIPYHPSEP
jgi:hypothetical protein